MIDARYVTLIVFITVFTAGGCTRVLPLDHDANVVDYDAARRGAYVFRLSSNEAGKPDRYVIVSEPPPDIAKEITTSLGLSAESIGSIGGGEATVEYANKVIDLAKRSQTLQVLREALFRLSESSVSANLQPNDWKALFTRVLETTEKLADAELRQAAADQNREAAAEHEAFRKLLQVPNLTEEQRQQLIRSRMVDVPVRDVTRDEDE